MSEEKPDRPNIPPMTQQEMDIFMSKFGEPKDPMMDHSNPVVQQFFASGGLDVPTGPTFSKLTETGPSGTEAAAGTRTLEEQLGAQQQAAGSPSPRMDGERPIDLTVRAGNQLETDKIGAHRE